MITVRQNQFIPYKDLEKSSQTVTRYPRIFNHECLSRLSTIGKMDSGLCISVGLLQLTGKLMGFKKNKIGTSACILERKVEFTAKNKKTGEKIIIKGKEGDVIVFGAFFREEWVYKTPKYCDEFYQSNPLSYIYLSTQQRFKYAREIKKILADVDKLPIWKQCVQKHLTLGKMLGSGSYGNVYLASLHNNRFAVKLSKLKPEALDEPYSRYVSSWFEVHFLAEIIKPIIQKNICPNLPLLFDNFVCDSCDLVIDRKKSNTACVITVVELANGDLKDYLRDYKPNDEEIYSALFQIMAALHAIQLHGQIMNYDVKKENVLFYKVDPGGYWHYKIHENNFYVPNYGYLFILNDFGISRPMSPKFPLYKNKTDLTFRLGSRYAIVQQGKFVPITTLDQVDSEVNTGPPTTVTWVGKDWEIANAIKTKGAQFRLLRKDDRVIPLNVKLTPKQKSYLKSKNISSNSTTHKFFMHPEIIPPFEFYNDTQDSIRMFIGGKRTTQRGYHRYYETFPKKIFNQIKCFDGPSESMKDGTFTDDPAQVLAGYFIEKFFTKNTNYTKRPKKGMKLATYVMS